MKHLTILLAAILGCHSKDDRTVTPDPKELVSKCNRQVITKDGWTFEVWTSLYETHNAPLDVGLRVSKTGLDAPPTVRLSLFLTSGDKKQFEERIVQVLKKTAVEGGYHIIVRDPENRVLDTSEFAGAPGIWEALLREPAKTGREGVRPGSYAIGMVLELEGGPRVTFPAIPVRFMSGTSTK